ncbi:hypothetical protein HYV22_04485 [Candidatus Gottesmanbacteria bacterium]|nr:hypothetical protein [Candidatus Gottesmanbacteria bacterium]
MYRLHLYFPEELKNKVALTSRILGKSKAEVVREALEVGLKDLQPMQSQSTANLLTLAKEAEKLPSKGPKDLSINHDYYAWGGKKRGR